MKVSSLRLERLRTSKVAVSILFQPSTLMRCVTSSIIAGDRSDAMILTLGCWTLICSVTIPGPQALSRMYDESMIGGEAKSTTSAAIKRVQFPDLMGIISFHFIGVG